MRLIESDRLLLQVFTIQDASAAERFWGDSEIMAASGGPTPLEVLPRILESYSQCHVKNGISVYAVIEKASGKLIGAAGFNVHDSLEQVELIYHFAKDSWGKGYATEAALLCVQLAKEHPTVRTITASAAPGHESSIHVLRKAGLRYIEMRWFDDTQQEEPYFELAVND
ncbi:GNAT family N-acetyltransferase [Planococcus sp. N064]|uniref:GNAT family N-acetyltransferase n=1 Tax=Planococcus liqunii TaxID=3058394 RepID=A0ABT8MT37_9BACL|nr:GNAT family N-acetyltransferase [Planococcus sp. N064]MDN7228062.1 GNAT family N-acetyltransferase [Planococcus sp. N064]